MTTIAWLATVLILAALTWDWMVKKRRVNARNELDDQGFLKSYQNHGEQASDDQILEARRWVARELGLPESKVRPEDRLSELRTHYCLVVSGDLALSDLFDDLESGSEEEQDLRHLDTVSDLISAYLRSNRRKI